MLFNSLFSMYQLFFLTLTAFFALFIFRHLCIKRKLSFFAYHIILFCILFVAAIGGGSVQNAGYDRLTKFIELEEGNKLEDAKQNLQNYDSMLAIDLQEFKNSNEFKDYLKRHDHDVDKAEAIFIGWLFVLISDIAMMCVFILQGMVSNIKNRFYSRLF